MTPELLSKLKAEAEEKYPVDKKYHTITDECWIHAERSAYIAGASTYCEKLEKIREEVAERMEALDRLRGKAKNEEHYVTAQLYANQYEELSRTLTMIIDKNL